MEIITALKTSFIRVASWNKWLFWDNASKEWIVCQHKHGARKNIRLYIGQSLEDALDALVSD